MESTSRHYKIIRLLKLPQHYSLNDLIGELEFSKATVKRDIEELRDTWGAPIEYVREDNRYRLTDTNYELPGLWFNPSEIYALLTMRHLLANLKPGILEEHIAPLKERLEKLLKLKKGSDYEIHRRVRILQIAHRSHELKAFETAAMAVMQRRRLRIRYFSRSKNERTDREVSPQRIVHYRDNWYLDAWCHLRKGLKTFSIDAIENVDLLDSAAKAISDQELDRVLTPGYGIFSGAPIGTAVLRFTPERARWISKEEWHPNQQSHFDQDGHFVLEVPYSDDRELLMEILKYGPDVEVLAPPALRAHAIEMLQQARSQYA